MLCTRKEAMRLLRWVFAVMVLVCCYFSSSCGGNSALECRSDLDTLSIFPRDTLGDSSLDSETGFAEIAEVCHGRDGSILVVDPKFATVRRYSGSGEYVLSYGVEGNGPGELNEPWDAAVSEAGVVFVSDLRGLNTYSFTDGHWLGLNTTYTSPILLRMIGNRDSCFTALHASYEIAGEQPVRNSVYSLYSNGIPSDVSYWNNSTDVDIADSRYTRLCHTQPIVAGDAENNVYVSRSTSDRLQILKYSPTGELIQTISETYQPQRLSDVERELEIEYYSLTTNRLGLSIDYTPEDEWNSVTSLGVDENSLIWARVGGSNPPLFRVFSPTGELRACVELGGVRGESRFADVQITPWGLTAFTFDPNLDFQELYIYNCPSF